MRPHALLTPVAVAAALVAVGALAASCAAAPAGETRAPDTAPVQIQRRPGEFTVYDRRSRRRYHVDVTAHRCYEVHALLDRCPPAGDPGACPRTGDAVRAANARARAAQSIGNCERTGCPDVQLDASCEEVRGLDESVAAEMTW